jgi:Skp family chaperone for outer membrane proteins
MNDIHPRRVVMGALFSLIAVTTSWADPPKSAGPIAVLNVERVLKSYQPLQDRLTTLRHEVQELDKNVQLRQAESETVQHQLRKAPPNSPEFEKLQVQLSRLQTELRLFVERERRTLQKKEADAYVVGYREMEEEVKKHCRQQGIKLVIRQTEGSLTDERVEEVLKAVNRPVVYGDDEIDITDEIVQALKERTKGEK